MRINRRIVQRGIYITALAAVVVFLFWQGPAPWVHVWQHWLVFLTVMAISAIGIVGQAYSFRAVAPLGAYVPAPSVLIRIWSMSGALSVVVPVFAGFGTRTVLLLQNGMTLPTTLLTSARQVWLGLEYALLLGGAAAVFIDYQGRFWFVLGLFCAWGGLLLLRLYALYSSDGMYAAHNQLQRMLNALSAPISIWAHFLFPVQVLLMSLTSYVAFHGFGAEIGWAGVILLAAITVLASLIVLVPNGIGVMDALWIGVGMHANLQLAQSVAFVLTLRLSYLAAATLVWILVSTVTHFGLNRRG